MYAILFDIVLQYFNRSTALIFIMENFLTIWVVPLLKVGNDTMKLFLISVILHFGDILQSKLSIIPKANMEAIVNKHVAKFFAEPLENHDFNFQKLTTEKSKTSRLSSNLSNKLKSFADRASDELSNIVTLTMQICILMYNIQYAFIAAIIMFYFIYISIKGADAKRFSEDKIGSKQSYLNSRNYFELYHSPSKYNSYIERLFKIQYEFANLWGEYSYKLIIQRIGIDYSVMGFAFYCICHIVVFGGSNLVMATCINFLKNIPKIRQSSRMYIGMMIDYNNLKDARDKLCCSKVPQINAFEQFHIPSQTINKSLEIIDDIKLPTTGSIVITGNSGHGKTTFLDSLCGMLPSNMTAQFFGNSPPQATASIRDICCVYNHNIEDVKGVSPSDLITSFDTLPVDARECATLAALPNDFDLVGRTSGETSKGQFQRIGVAEVLARVIADSSKKIIILDELTDGLDNDTAIQLVQNIIDRFSTSHLIFFVTHNTVVRDFIRFDHLIDVADMKVMQVR